ncbi:2-hydroxyacyl-CoA dehydratase [Thermodesulfobacteriota bacterium]
MSEQRGARQLESVNAIRAYKREVFRNAKERAKQGEPFAICHGDEIEEIFNVLDIPTQIVNSWNAIIHMKGMTDYYRDVLTQRGYVMPPFRVLALANGLACTMDNNPEIAPWGGLPKPSIIIGSRTNVDFKILELWAREYDCPFYQFQKDGYRQPHPPRWWERLRDHWDEEVDSRRLDFRVEQLKEVTHCLESVTGRTFSIAKLNKAMEILNEQMDYFGKVRDLIGNTVPCPVSVRDQLSVYQTMWHRGTTEARDLMKAYYKEVKERVEKGIAAVPNEKLRIMWDELGGTPPAWARYVGEKHGAAVIAPLYMSIAREAYYRKVSNNDPLRAIASRHLMFFAMTPEWRVRDAELCKCDGVIDVITKGSKLPSPQRAVFEKAGIPHLHLPRDSDDTEIRSILDEFITTRLLST